MKQLFLYFLLSTSFCGSAQSVPQFSVTVPLSSTMNVDDIFWGYQGGHMQALYYSSDFPGMPAGTITKLYVRAGNNVQNSVYCRNVLIKMGYMPQHETGGDSMQFKTQSVRVFYNTDTVFYSPAYTFNPPIDSADWVGFVLQKPFYFNGINNFILDIMQDSIGPPLLGLDNISFSNSATSNRFYQSARSYSPSSGWYWPDPSIAHKLYVVGFDLQPNGIDDISNLSNLNIYPNPTAGRFTVSFSADQHIRQASVRVTNIVGSSVFQQTYNNITGKSSREIDMRGVAPGVYFVEMNADGQKVTRKLVVE